MVRDWFYPDHVAGGVFNFLSSSQVDHRQDAINLVSLWRFRDPKLTHALISTATLTDAILHDQPGKRDQFSSLALRSIYAMAFCRFVNALVDRDVRKSVTATIVKDLTPAGPVARPEPQRGTSSMYANAMELGLPESFVELRHQAIHEDMPSLEVLRAMTGEALEWLWDRWWKYNVKGSGEPALSLWMEKHGKRNPDEVEVGAGENGLGLEPSALCANCRRQKIPEDDSISGDGRNGAFNDTDPREQQKLATEPEGKASSAQQPQKWVMRFHGGIPTSTSG